MRSDGTPRWSPHESDAAAVVLGAFGEVSVRWVDELDAYVLLAMDGPEDPVGKGVTLRSARQPWGPWTPRRRLFDWEPVSYTHLDVYKRQGPFRPIGGCTAWLGCVASRPSS